MEFKLRFKLDKETKGAIRYQEVDPATGDERKGNDAVVGTLYIRKYQISGDYPGELIVTIASGD